MLAAGAQDHGRARQSTVSIRVVRGLIAGLEQRGVPRAVFLDSAQLCPEQLAFAEVRITLAEVYRLCELAIELTADPALGLHWGEKPAGSAFNPLSDLIAHAATLRHGLEAMCQFHPLFSDEVSFQLSEGPGKVTLRRLRLSGASERVHRFMSEVFMVGLFQLLRWFNGEARLEASFEYAAPAYHAEYARVLDGAERFEQPLTGIVFDRVLMDAASPLKDEDVHDALRATAERQMLRMQRASFAMRVRELLLQQRSAGQIDMTSLGKDPVTGALAINMYRSSVTNPRPVNTYIVGTMNVNLPPMQASEVVANCSARQPVQLIAAFPHMHMLGRSMRFEVGKSADAMTTIFLRDPFDFNDQRMDKIAVNLAQGDALRLTCKYQNTNSKAVTYGESTLNEMCYLIGFAIDRSSQGSCIQ